MESCTAGDNNRLHPQRLTALVPDTTQPLSLTRPHPSHPPSYPMQRPITLNMGMSMPGWFDITSLDDINQKEDTAGMAESTR